MTLTTAGFPPKDVSIQGSTLVKITAFAITLADTEYEFTLQNDLKQLRIRCRESANLRIAFVLGDTDDGNGYWSIYKGCCDNINDINFTDKKLYLRSDKASVTIEVMELY